MRCVAWSRAKSAIVVVGSELVRVRVRVVIRAYEQVLLCAYAAYCRCATMRSVSCMKLSRFAGDRLFGCGRKEIASKHGCLEHAQHFTMVSVQSFRDNAEALGQSTRRVHQKRFQP